MTPARAGRRWPSTLASVTTLAGSRRLRFGGPVALLGDSLGGITCWYSLAREPDVDAVVCHCIGHPDVDLDAAMAWKGPLMGALGTVLPYAPVPVRQIADYGKVALEPDTQAFFDEESDIAFNFTVTAGSAASYIGFRPARGWHQVDLPVRVEIGVEDGMVSPEFTRRCFAQAHPDGAQLEEIPGAGHQLYLDHLDRAYPRLLAWLEQSVA